MNIIKWNIVEPHFYYHNNGVKTGQSSNYVLYGEIKKRLSPNEWGSRFYYSN